MTVLALPFLTSCGAGAPDSLEFDAPRFNLPPGTVKSLNVHGIKSGKEGPEKTLISESLQFSSDRPGEFSVDSDGILSLSADLLAGETARITVRHRGREAVLTVMVRPDRDATIDADAVLRRPAALDSLVNKERFLPEGYVPEDLVRISVPTILTFEEVNHLRLPAAEALKELFETAWTEAGLNLYARSGYRSYETQRGLYQAAVARDGQEWADRYSAVPGSSEHQTGLAMDITAESVRFQLEESFGSTGEGRWVEENAHRFGFILRYLPGKEDITGYNYEPWHLRYLGEAAATEIYRRGLTLEEFYDLPEEETR